MIVFLLFFYCFSWGGGWVEDRPASGTGYTGISGDWVCAETEVGGDGAPVAGDGAGADIFCVLADDHCGGGSAVDVDGVDGAVVAEGLGDEVEGGFVVAGDPDEFFGGVYTDGGAGVGFSTGAGHPGGREHGHLATDGPFGFGE